MEELRLLQSDHGSGNVSARAAERIVPPTIREVIERRLSKLSEACRQALTFAAVVGREFAVSTLRAMPDHDEDRLIDALDEARLEGYFNHLSAQVKAGKYSPNYAHTLLMTAKQFIGRLAELRLIPLPGNMRSRRLRFNHSAPAKIEMPIMIAPIMMATAVF